MQHLAPLFGFFACCAVGLGMIFGITAEIPHAVICEALGVLSALICITLSPRGYYV